MAQFVSDFGKTTKVWCAKKEKEVLGAREGGYTYFEGAMVIKGENR
jgi:hypothetical protein